MVPHMTSAINNFFVLGMLYGMLGSKDTTNWYQPTSIYITVQLQSEPVRCDIRCDIKICAGVDGGEVEKCRIYPGTFVLVYVTLNFH